jgi:adenine deaminase
VFERHAGTGNRGLGFIKGLGIKEGAVASTVAHDSHNLVVAGADDEDMLVASKTVVESEGGLVVVRNRTVLAHLSLPIGGLMSNETVENVSEKIERIRDAWTELGSNLPSPYMTLSFTTLSVIPELRITDKGLLDTVQFRFVPPIIA